MSVIILLIPSAWKGSDFSLALINYNISAMAYIIINWPVTG